jgi:hypothetical protein
MSQDIWFEPQTKGTSNDDYVVYMIPGNPCIMTYYQQFMSTLFGSLNDALAPRKISAHVGGYTLPGFGLQPGRPSGVRLPASLKSQVKHTEELIRIALLEHVQGENDAKRPKVVLVTHSISAYIALEILRRRAEGHSSLSDVDIVGSVHICPTVTHIAHSRNGVRAKVCPEVKLKMQTLI